MLLNNYMPSVATITRGDQYSDYAGVNSRQSFLQANYSADQQGGWSISTWEQLYAVNLMLKNMVRAKGNVSKAVYNHYEGVARYWRASFYFGMVKTFSDVPWYDYPIEPDDNALLYAPRDSREYIMSKVLEDINFAAENCLASSEYLNNSLINKYVALALKSRICLYEGTFRKYHSVNPATNTAWTNLYETSADLLREAADASAELMNNSPYAVASDITNVSTFYRSLFNKSEFNTKEVIWGREYDGELARHDASLQFNATGNQSNRISPLKSFVNTYLNLDGTRFTDKVGWETMTLQDEFKNRDYRLSQTIMGPGFTKKINGTVSDYAPNLAITMTGYQIIKWNIDDDSYETVSNSYNSIPLFRMGEIVLNFAEAKCELGEFGTDEWNRSIRLLRERAGVSGGVPVSADPYLVAYFDNSITDMYLLEIRRERGIEMYFENLRWDDLMRWKMGDLFANEWASMYIPAKNTVYDLTGNGVTLYSVVDSTPSQPQTGVYYIDLSSSAEYKYIDGHLIIDNSDIAWETRKYVHPIPTAAVVKNPALGQNYGW
jgi:hypothetical protein